MKGLITLGTVGSKCCKFKPGWALAGDDTEILQIVKMTGIVADK